MKTEILLFFYIFLCEWLIEEFRFISNLQEKNYNLNFNENKETKKIKKKKRKKET
jgi:hypothetical protein